MKLAAPYVSKSGGRSKAASAFNEGAQIPKAEWDRIVKRDPALASKDKAERTEATKKSMLSGELAKYRRR